MTHIDLKTQKYPISCLRENIYALDMISILETQVIDEEFAANYILNPDYQLTEEEEKITLQMVLQKQPHLDHVKLISSFLLQTQNNSSLPPMFDQY
jgi:hypothetical protein